MASPANEAMRQAWDGPEGAQWSELAEGFERASMEHRTVLLRAAALAAGEDVLDLGCGNGALTLQVGAAVAPGRVVGIDLSSAMLANGRARAAAAGRSNVSFVHADAQVYAFEPASFDVVVSNAGAMFFDDQTAAFSNLRNALKPGGRIVLLVWQVLESNEWLTELRRALALGRDLPTPPVGTPGPFGLADPDHTRDLLARTGYSSIRIEDARPPMRVGDDVESAYAFVSRMGNTRGLLDDLNEDDRIAALGNLRSVLAKHATPQGVVLGTASWLVTATHQFLEVRLGPAPSGTYQSCVEDSAVPISTPVRRHDITASADSPDMIEAADATEPIEKMDPADPIEPTDRTEPTEPTESNEPREPMLRNESLDLIDQREPSSVSFTG